MPRVRRASAPGRAAARYAGRRVWTTALGQSGDRAGQARGERGGPPAIRQRAAPHAAYLIREEGDARSGRAGQALGGSGRALQSALVVCSSETPAAARGQERALGA